jgi:hypothetical protein
MRLFIMPPAAQKRQEAYNQTQWLYSTTGCEWEEINSLKADYYTK